MRIARYEAKKPRIGKSLFWERMVGCLLTTRNRSGHDSPVSQFLKKDPFLLSYDRCVSSRNIAKSTATTLQKFGGIRRFNIIGDQVAANLLFLESGCWQSTLLQINSLRTRIGFKDERRVAEFIDDNLRGFGPK